MSFQRIIEDVFKIIFLLLQILFTYCQAAWDAITWKERTSINGKVVVITGGSRGIGKEIATRLVRLGAKVALWDILEKENIVTANELQKLGGDVQAFTCDVTNVDSVHKAAELTRKEYGDPDILINNAGVMVCKDILLLSEKDIRRTFEVNCIAPFWTVREFLPTMLNNRRGHIVTIASMASKAGTPLLTDYCASKYGVYGFMESLAEEMRLVHRCPNIYFTTVCPMFVNTNLLTDISDRVNIHIGRGDRMLNPGEVAEAVVAGIRYGKRYVYIPRINIISDTIFGLLPKKGSQLLTDFLDARFSSK